MLRLSVNLLSNMIGYLKEIKSTDNYLLREPMVPYHSYSVSIDSLCELATCCGWIESLNGYAHVAQRGKLILSQPGFGLTYQKLQLMLHDYVLKIRPIWANRILYGRKEAFIFMTKDEKACFLEAGLMSDEISKEIIGWWDSLAAELRQSENEKMNAIGRHGEKLTIQYEYNRTGKRPQWMSVDSNLAGYDLISQIDSTQNIKMLIEVKASSMPINLANFHVTLNEWKVASTSNCYRFYIWSINDVISLAVVTPEELQSLMPINQQSGEWETVRIPFSAFTNCFKVINP